MPVPAEYSRHVSVPVPVRYSRHVSVPVPVRYSRHVSVPVPVRYSRHVSVPVPVRYSRHVSVPVPVRYSRHVSVPVPAEYSRHVSVPVPAEYSRHVLKAELRGDDERADLANRRQFVLDLARVGIRLLPAGNAFPPLRVVAHHRDPDRLPHLTLNLSREEQQFNQHHVAMNDDVIQECSLLGTPAVGH